MSVMMKFFRATLLFALLLFRGVQGLTLFSPLTEGSHISACPNTSVILTCTATNVSFLKWFAVPGLRDRGVTFTSVDVNRTINKSNFTLTLVEPDSNRTELLINFTSTLEVMVDDLIDNGTTVTCQAGEDQEQLIINKRSPPSFQSQVRVEIDNFQTENFSITLTWDVQNADGYRISVNSTTQPAVDTNKTTIALEGQYNISLLINITAINCAGISEELVEVYEGSSPTPPVSIDGTSTPIGPRPSPSGNPTSDSSTTPVGLIAAPVTVVGAAAIVVVAVTVLVIIHCRHRSNVRKKPHGTNENTYGERELLAVMPDSSTSSGGLPSPQPLSGPSYDTVTTDNATAFYDDVKRTTTGSGQQTSEPVFTISQNSTVTAPPQLYSEANNRKRQVELSGDSMATSHLNNDAAEYSTPCELSKARKPPQKYTDVVVEQKRALSPLNLADQAVQYSEIQPSHHPPGPTLPPKPSARSPPPAPYSLPLQGGDKHPLDKNISIDKVIQQLQELAPHWRVLGEAAHIQPAILENIAAHFKENEIDSFIEVMNQYFIPNKTRWADVAAVCEKAGFMDMSDALLGAYDTGFLPVQIEEEEKEVRPPPSKPAPPIPPRSSEGDDEDTPPTLHPPLAPEDVFDMAPARRKPPALPSSDQSPPPRPPKSHKPPARPPRQ